MEMINVWMTTLLKYAAFGGELPSCDFLTGARGDIFSAFLDVTVLLCLSHGFIFVTSRY